MKKIIIKIFLFISVFGLFAIDWNFYVYTATVTVTERIPGVCGENNTKVIERDVTVWIWSSKRTVRRITYECEIKPWFTSVMIMIWKMIKYFTFLAGLWWMLFIVINGIMYSMWWIDQGLKDESKKRIIQTLVWLIVLLLSWIILNIIAPWIWVL